MPRSCGTTERHLPAAEGHRATYLSSQETHQVDEDTSQVGQETAQPTSQVGPETAQVVAQLFEGRVRSMRVPEAMTTRMTTAQVKAAARLKDRVNFSRAYIQPFLEAGLIQPEHPEPNHPQQRYVITDAGRGVLAALKQGQAT